MSYWGRKKPGYTAYKGTMRILPCYVEDCFTTIGLSVDEKFGTLYLFVWSDSCLYAYRFEEKLHSSPSSSSLTPSENLHRISVEPQASTQDFTVIGCFLLPSEIITVVLLNASVICVTKDGLVELENLINPDGTVTSLSPKKPPSKSRLCILNNFSFVRRGICQAKRWKGAVTLCFDNGPMSSWDVEAVCQESFGSNGWQSLFGASVCYDSNGMWTASDKHQSNIFSSNLCLEGRQSNSLTLPVIYHVGCNSADTPKSDTVSSTFFDAVFGNGSIFPESSVVILGLPDGRVVWWPMIRLRSKPTMLWCLEQPVIAIFKNNLPKSAKEVLVIVGRFGKVVLISDQVSYELCASELPRGLATHIPEFTPVNTCLPDAICCPLTSGWLHVTHGSNVWHHSLLHDKTDPKVRIQSCCTGISNVRGMSVLSSSGENVQAAIVSLDGNIYVKKWNMGDWAKIDFSSVGGISLSSLIEGICSCSEKMQMLEGLLAEQSEVLKQLSIMASLIYLTSDDQEFVMPIKASVVYDSDGLTLPLKVECGFQLSLPTSYLALGNLPVLHQQLPLYITVRTFFIDSLSALCHDKAPQIPKTSSYRRRSAILRFAKERRTYDLLKDELGHTHTFDEVVCFTVKTTDKALKELPPQILPDMESATLQQVSHHASKNVLCSGSQVSFSVSCEAPFASIILKGRMLATLCCFRSSLVHHLSRKENHAVPTSECEIPVSLQGLEGVQLIRHHLQFAQKTMETLPTERIIQLYLLVRKTISTLFPIC